MRFFARKDHWLDSHIRGMVEASVGRQLHDVIHKCLRSKMTTNFSPEECADIILGQMRQLANNPEIRKDIVCWIQKN